MQYVAHATSGFNPRMQKSWGGAVAAPVAVAGTGLILIAVLMIGLTIAAALREERAWLRSPRGQAYRIYRAKTGMFVPFIGRG